MPGDPQAAAATANHFSYLRRGNYQPQPESKESPLSPNSLAKLNEEQRKELALLEEKRRKALARARWLAANPEAAAREAQGRREIESGETQRAYTSLLNSVKKTPPVFEDIKRAIESFKTVFTSGYMFSFDYMADYINTDDNLAKNLFRAIIENTDFTLIEKLELLKSLFEVNKTDNHEYSGYAQPHWIVFHDQLALYVYSLLNFCSPEEQEKEEQEKNVFDFIKENLGENEQCLHSLECSKIIQHLKKSSSLSELEVQEFIKLQTSKPKLFLDSVAQRLLKEEKPDLVDIKYIYKHAILQRIPLTSAVALFNFLKAASQFSFLWKEKVMTLPATNPAKILFVHDWINTRQTFKEIELICSAVKSRFDSQAYAECIEKTAKQQILRLRLQMNSTLEPGSEDYKEAMQFLRSPSPQVSYTQKISAFFSFSASASTSSSPADIEKLASSDKTKAEQLYLEEEDKLQDTLGKWGLGSLSK